MSELNIFVPLTKIDVEKRLVYGVVAAEVKDNSGETFDYDKSKPYFQKWSDLAYATSGGLSKGNLREMHGKVAAGKLTDLAFNDAQKTIECCAEVVDDAAWNKCLKGVYTGFSMGGRYAERFVSKSDDGSEEKRYAGDPAEVSLVDKPCIPTATFQLIKADGMVEEHRFVSVIDDLAKADEPYGDVKYADPGYRDDKKRYPIDTEEHIRAAWSYINKEKNAGEYSADQLSKIKAKIVAAWKSKIDKDGPPSAAKADTGDDLMKTQYVPTNDEMLPVAQELAKAAGTEALWLDFMDAARDKLVSDRMAKADDDEGKEDKGDFDPDAEKGPKEDGTDDGTKPSGGDDDKGGSDDDGDEADEYDKDKEAAEKSDAPGDVPAPEQGWKAKDGTFFVKKADALSHNASLAKAAGTGTADTNKEPSLLELAKAAAATASEILGGGAEADEPKSELVKYADFFEGVTKFEGDDLPLQKSMYTVERMARALREVASLQIAVSQEQKREGDDSHTPGMIGIAVGQLGDTLIEMAKEEVEELLLQVANNGVGGDDPTLAYSDCYYELADKTMGLEKADFDELAKAAVNKKGEYLQKMHDKLAKMGAKCTTPAAHDDMNKVDGADELQKLSDANAELQKRADGLQTQVDEALPLLKTLMDDMAKIKAMPQPAAPRTSIVEKSDDVRGVGQLREETGATLLEKFTPAQLADAAFRVAQQNGVTMTARGMVPNGQ